MPQFDNFIFFDEVVRITFIFLFVYMLLCLYFSPFFFKSRIFLAAVDNIQKLNLHLKIVLQSKIYVVVLKTANKIGLKTKNSFFVIYVQLCRLKNYKEYFCYIEHNMLGNFLTASTLFFLLYLQRKINTVEVLSEKVTDVATSMYFYFLLFFLLCFYFGYIKTCVKQETYLYSELVIPKPLVPLILVIEVLLFCVFCFISLIQII